MNIAPLPLEAPTLPRERSLSSPGPRARPELRGRSLRAVESSAVHVGQRRDAPSSTPPDADVSDSTPHIAQGEPPTAWCSDDQFFAMREAFRASGGLVRGDDFAQMLEEYRQGNFVSLAKMIVARQVFSFEWKNAHWIPMFQFEPESLAIRNATSQIVAELKKDLDDWSLALWFTEPNGWLNEQRPIDLIDTGFPDVLNAARADRFIANA